MDISDHLPMFLMTSDNGIMDLNSAPPTYRIIKPSTISRFKELNDHLSWNHVLTNRDPQKAYTIFISIHLNEFKMYRNKLNHITRGAKKHYFSNKLSESKNNMRALWSVINQTLNKRKNKSLPNEFQVDASLTKDPVAIAHNFQ